MFRVMTLNLNYEGAGHGAWPERRARVAHEIGQWNPHLVALQAVAQSADGDNQAEQLSRALPGYIHVWFEPVMVEPGGAAKGMAFLGRVPFERRGTRPLTHRRDTDDHDRRTVLRVHSPASGGIEFYNAHFSWVEEQARDNVREALSFLNDARAPALLLGDFNQPPERELHTRLREAGWVDAWSWLRGAEAGYTYEANRPQSRIDFAYANARLSGRLAEIHVIGEAYRALPRLSDHLGLVVTLTLG
jgi:endonuclease/exonuclease/phosphatase family metal-dependent hydrolase